MTARLAAVQTSLQRGSGGWTMDRRHGPGRQEPPAFWVIWALMGAILGGAVVAFLGRANWVTTNISYTDLAAVLLAAVTILLSIFGIIAAAAAIYGYRWFMDKAEETAIREVKHYLDSNAEKILQERADAVLGAGSKRDSRMDDEEDLLDELQRESGGGDPQ